jgi:hypothetical protein
MLNLIINLGWVVSLLFRKRKPTEPERYDNLKNEWVKDKTKWAFAHTTRKPKF